MLFALICTDKPDSVSVRMDNRPDHVAHLEALGDKLKFAGPFLGPDGETPVGSLVMLEAADAAAARAVADSDPYARAGLFQSVDIRPWKWTVKAPDGV